MTAKPKYYSLVTDDVIVEARQYVRPGVTDEEISQMLSDTFDLLEEWFKPEVV